MLNASHIYINCQFEIELMNVNTLLYIYFHGCRTNYLSRAGLEELYCTASNE